MSVTIKSKIITCTLLGLLTVSCTNTTGLNQPELSTSSETKISEAKTSEAKKFTTMAVVQLPEGFNEDAYHAAFADVATAIRTGVFPNAYAHYAGDNSQGRNLGVARLFDPKYLVAKADVDDGGYNEAVYLSVYPDVAALIPGTFTH